MGCFQVTTVEVICDKCEYVEYFKGSDARPIEITDHGWNKVITKPETYLSLEEFDIVCDKCFNKGNINT